MPPLTVVFVKAAFFQALVIYCSVFASSSPESAPLFPPYGQACLWYNYIIIRCLHHENTMKSPGYTPSLISVPDTEIVFVYVYTHTPVFPTD